MGDVRAHVVPGIAAANLDPGLPSINANRARLNVLGIESVEGIVVAVGANNDGVAAREGLEVDEGGMIGTAAETLRLFMLRDGSGKSESGLGRG